MNKKLLHLIFVPRLAYVFLATVLFSNQIHAKQIIKDITGLSPTRVNEVVAPNTITELQTFVKNSQLPISIAGARCSQGGQIAYQDGLVIDMEKLNKVLNLNLKNKTVTVQAGITWRKLIEKIDPFNLTIKSMQSYSDFSVGGSMAVNAHCRSVHNDPVINSVKSFKIVNAAGELITASRTQNSEYFYATIGGYGLVGIIVETTLQLQNSAKIKSDIKVLKVDEYKGYFFNTVIKNPDLRLHSAYLCPVHFNQIISATWNETNQSVTVSSRLRNKLNPLDRLSVNMAHYTLLKRFRSWIAPYTRRGGAIVHQNYEMSDRIRALDPMLPTSHVAILQEYFIPVANLEAFIADLKHVTKKYNVNMLNIGIRHVSADNESMMTYAPKEAFALVLYIDVPKKGIQAHNEKWTRELVDRALRLDGRYYLPYHLYPTKAQLYKSYPEVTKFLDFKKTVDPKCRFRNSLYKKYFE
jgi:FAD/FMN-containing dehydrogenase